MAPMARVEPARRMWMNWVECRLGCSQSVKMLSSKKAHGASIRAPSAPGEAGCQRSGPGHAGTGMAAPALVTGPATVRVGATGTGTVVGHLAAGITNPGAPLGRWEAARSA